MMTRQMLFHYLSDFPLQLALALAFFFIPLKKLEKWQLRLPLVLLAAAAEIGMWMLLYPMVPSSQIIPRLIFALHYLLIFVIYGAGICLMSEATRHEAAYCVVCAYMVQHLGHCFGLVTDHLLGTPPDWWTSDPAAYVKLILICLAVYLLFIRRICRDGHYPNSALRAISLYVLVMAVMFFLSIRVSELEEGWLHGVYTGLLIIILMYEELRSAEQLRLQQEIQTREHMDKLHRAQYEMSKENIALLNRKSHDLRRQVAALRAVGTPEEQSEVISEIEQAVEIYDRSYRTGNRALDTVLMQEALKCSQNHIELTVVADGKLLSFIRSVDLYTMLSNILDNAVEANLRMEDPARRAIHLSVHEKKGLVILQCENPYEGRITMRDGLPETVKADKENHGIGTRSISATAAAYGGVVRIDPRDGMYVLCIIFQPPDTSQDEKTTT